MATGRLEGHGPSWQDVGGYLRLIERTAGVHLKVSSECVWDLRRKREQWYWRVEAVNVIGKTSRGHSVSAAGEFPTVGHRTVPALLYRLVHEVSEKLSREQAEREQQTAF